MHGIFAGLGTILSTIFSSNFTSNWSRLGVREVYNKLIIIPVTSSSSSPIKIYFPFPDFAQSVTKSIEAPDPIPIVCTVLFLTLFLIRSITLFLSSTSPSVSKKMCLGYPIYLGVLKMAARGFKISVPPKSASNC